MAARAAPPDQTSRPGFRADIEGLRAVAVGLVVLLHAGVMTVSGGYIGVDVFFVISGFLITSLLIEEISHAGRISLLAFYARRARRILPAASLVIAVTVFAVYELLGPVVASTTSVDGVWAACFVANVRFIRLGADYFAQALPPSALQHYWSLAVEEQFYLVWPSLLLGLALLGRRVGRTTTIIRVGLLVVVGGSLVWSIHQSAIAPTTAYFSPLARAWELGIGALIAVFSGAGRRVPPAVWAAATWVGLVLVLIAAFTFTSSTVFPGYVALVPVGGAALIIAGGVSAPPGAVVLLLGRAPLRWLGRISFSLYLWHWPVLVLAEQRSAAPLGPAARAGCVALALALSVVTYYLLERPLHTGEILKARNARSDWGRAHKAVLAGGLAIVVAAGVSLLVDRLALAAISGAPPIRQRASELAAGLDPTSPDAERFAALGARVAVAVRTGLTLHDIPEDVQPPALRIGAALSATYVDCMEHGVAAVETRACTFGDRASSHAIVVFGDSHAMQWMPAVDAYGGAKGYRVIAMQKARCAPPSVDVKDAAAGGGAPQSPSDCSTWREHALARIRALRPDGVVMSFHQTAEAITSDAERVRWLEGLRRTVQRLKGTGARVFLIGANPSVFKDVRLCVTRPNADPANCPGAFADRALAEAELRLVEALGATAIDTRPMMCAPQGCPVVIAKRIAYAGGGHLSAQYVSYLEPLLAVHFRIGGLR